MNPRSIIFILLLFFFSINCPASDKSQVPVQKIPSKSELNNQSDSNKNYREDKSSLSNDIMNEVTNNVSEEYCTCAAYFMIVSEGFKRSNRLKTAQQYSDVSKAASEAAFEFAKHSRTSEIAGKVTSARIEMSTKEMVDEINNNIENISILMNKYGNHCKNIMEDPDSITYEWTNKIMKKYLEK